MLTILSHVTAVCVLFVIGMTLIVLPIFFYNIPKYKARDGVIPPRPTPFRLFPYLIMSGIVCIIPMLCYFYLDIKYDVSKFTLNDKLYLASENNSIKAAKVLLKEGADPDGETRYGSTAAYRAVQLDLIELEMLYLEYGSNPNHCGHDRITPIGVAAGNQSCEMAKLLIAAGADPDYRPDLFVPALHYAGMNDRGFNAELVDILIAGGADPAASAVKNGKVILPFRYYYDEYKANPYISDEAYGRYTEITRRLYPAYVSALMGSVHDNFGYSEAE